MKSGWSGIMQVTCGLLNAGLSETYVRDLLLQVSPRTECLHVASDGKPRPSSRVNKDVAKAIRKGRERVLNNRPIRDKNEAVAHLVAIRDHLDESPTHWHGTGGSHDLEVTLVMFDMAIGACRLEFGASTYEIAERSGMGQPAAAKAIRRLMRTTGDRPAVVERVQPKRGRAPAVYRFNRGYFHDPIRPAKKRDSEWAVVVPRADAHDVWRHPGLGKATRRVYVLLGDDPRSRGELAQALGLKPESVRTHLRKLRRAGLAEPTDGGWVRLAEPDLDRVANELGVLGKGAIQMAMHASRRASYHSWLDHRGGMTTTHRDVQTTTEADLEETAVTEEQASEETAHQMMAWVRLRTVFDRAHLELLAERHGDDALYGLADDLAAVPA